MKNEWEKRIQSYRQTLSKSSAWYLAAEELYKAEEIGNRKTENSKEQFSHNVRAGVTAYVLAPMLCSYILWVLNEAVKSGKQRLYFLARDGWQMYQIANVLCTELQLPIECRYLYCSRYALRSAEYCIREKRRCPIYALAEFQLLWKLCSGVREFLMK